MMMQVQIHHHWVAQEEFIPVCEDQAVMHGNQNIDRNYSCCFPPPFLIRGTYRWITLSFPVLLCAVCNASLVILQLYNNGVKLLWTWGQFWCLEKTPLSGYNYPTVWSSMCEIHFRKVFPHKFWIMMLLLTITS